MFPVPAASNPGTSWPDPAEHLIKLGLYRCLGSRSILNPGRFSSATATAQGRKPLDRKHFGRNSVVVMKNPCLIVRLLLPCWVAATSATGQELTPIHQPVRHLVWNGHEAVELPGYQPRFAVVYDSDSTAPCDAFVPYANVLDDVSFGPVGPWATTSNNVLRSIRFPLGNSGTALLSFDVRLSIWNAATFTANPMIPTSEVPLYRATFPIVRLSNGAFSLTHNIPGTPPTLPGNRVFVQLEYFSPGTTNPLPTTPGSPAPTWAVNRVTIGPGSSTEQWGLDINNNGALEGGTLGSSEHRRTTLTSGPCASQPVNLPLILTGDIPVQPPASLDLGTLSNALTRTDLYAAGQVKWFSFRLPGDVSDAARTFLDITTVGSAMTGTSLALYSGNGSIVWHDSGGGPGQQSQLSFGIGRRGADGDGSQFDGYDGELRSGDTYYLGAAQAGTIFSDAFVVTPVLPGLAGGVTLTFRSNVAGGGLSASVAPIEVAELGQLVAPGASGPTRLPGLKEVLWFRFEICRAVDGANEDSYLDIDFARSEPTGDADQAAFLFDIAGNLIASSDDDGPGRFPQFSFGHPGPRGPYQGSGQEFTGSSGGGIGLGIYYLAVGPQPIQTLTNAMSSGRFHVRPLSGTNLNIAADFYVGNLECGADCPVCPADYNQDGGVDGGDLESFFLDWVQAIGCSDTNQDGGVDGSDVESFFIVWEAGGC